MKKDLIFTLKVIIIDITLLFSLHVSRGANTGGLHVSFGPIGFGEFKGGFVLDGERSEFSIVYDRGVIILRTIGIQTPPAPPAV